MLTIKKKKQLEMILETIPSHPKPKVFLEQYTTPSVIASDLLWNAFSMGDIDGRSVIDLGCGTGIFSIGSILLGADKALGIDIDVDSVEAAQNISKDMGINGVNFKVLDVNKINSLSNVIESENLYCNEDFKVETLFQNPPFGSQEKGQSGADRKFIDLAMKSSEVIYSFHMLSTEKFVYKYFENLGGNITHRFQYQFPLPKIYDFHTKEFYNVDVLVLRVENF